MCRRTLIASSIITLLSACGCVRVLPLGDSPQGSASSLENVIQATIRVSANNETIDGVGVLPLTSVTKLVFEFPHPAKFLMLRTRHRQETFSFKDARERFIWRYFPRTWVERHPDELSPLEVIAVDEKARETRALVVWSQQNGLAGELGCNGESRKVDGVSVCQSYQGLVQEILFRERTRVEVGRNDCDVWSMDRGYGYRWHYRIARGICVMEFTSEKDTRRTHRHISRGYTDAITH